MKTTKADLIKMLKKVLPHIETPDHTGEVRENGRTGVWDSVPLHENDCACSLHQLHVEVRAFLAACEK